MSIVKYLSLCTVLACAGCASTAEMTPPESLPDHWLHNSPNVLGGSKTTVSYRSKGRDETIVTSLWSSSPQSLFGDRRANNLGDILTVVIEIDEQAQMQNSASRNRQAGENLDVDGFFGLPQLAAKILPNGASLSPGIDISKSSTQTGAGNISRKEKLTLRLAARVVAVAGNGYLRLSGRQEIMVNNEVRFLQVSGLVRKRDISRVNTITYDKIADARIYYGGKGQLTDTVKPKTGNKILSKLSPF